MRSVLIERFLLSILSSLLVTIVFSCAPPPDLTHKDCIPDPPPDCKPGLSKAVGIDTVNLQRGRFKYHIDLLPKPFNSDKNDNAIAFFEKYALISGDREDGNQGIWSSEMLPDLHFRGRKEFIQTQHIVDAGACVYCRADSKLYFTAKADNDDPNDYDLYSTFVDARGLTIDEKPELKPEEIKSINELNKKNNFDGQPTVSYDGLMIVFASDRAGGAGGVDLWYSTRSSLTGKWSEPKPLPSSINTPCDELSPSFSADGKKLFFSSDGHETIGGYDIFSSSQSGGSWTNAENLGTPINTISDEIFPYQLSDSQFFYTSDQQTAFSGRNIFVLRKTFIPSKDFAEKNPTSNNIPEGDIPDTIQLKGRVEMPPSEDMTKPDVFVRDVAKDKEIARKPADSGGNYSFRVPKGREYDVGSELKDKFYDVHRVDTRHPRDSVISVPPLVIPDTLVLRINFPFDDDSHPYDFMINESGEKSEMRWQTSIDLLANSIKNSLSKLDKVILYGHTDSLGTDDYNFALATRRAAFIARQLKARGIPERILLIFSKGRTMPIKRSASESDEIFQLRSRRVEFVKVFKKEKMR